MRRRVVAWVSIFALGAIVVAVIVHLLPTTIRTVQLLPTQVRVTECLSDGGDLVGAADVVNPTRSRANLVFSLEFDWKNQQVGLLNLVAPRVGPGAHTFATGQNSASILFSDRLQELGRLRLTCIVRTFGDGGIVPLPT